MNQKDDGVPYMETLRKNLVGSLAPKLPNWEAFFENASLGNRNSICGENFAWIGCH